MEKYFYEVECSTCSDDDYDSILQTLIIRDISNLLNIPGVYEIISEHYNYEVLEIWMDKESS